MRYRWGSETRCSFLIMSLHSRTHGTVRRSFDAGELSFDGCTAGCFLAGTGAVKAKGLREGSEGSDSKSSSRIHTSTYMGCAASTPPKVRTGNQCQRSRRHRIRVSCTTHTACMQPFGWGASTQGLALAPCPSNRSSYHSRDPPHAPCPSTSM